MESDQFKPSKFHYDIAMSKRTRKSSMNFVEQDHVNIDPIQAMPAGEEEFVVVEKEQEEDHTNRDELVREDDDNKKSLKELINGGRNSLSQHFSDEEKNLPLIVKVHDQEGSNRLKLKRMVSRYAKVLSHLVKLKRKSESGFHKKSFVSS
ncbi:OLC1v1001714C1 [Oldenlandia corymbosa var. corymbosa]|uniref:OLC1v1001714C1 n=1 Tax=Oldenlandia corymbosa var. corymbosa TaxID=529605 RepID=A0AAV1D8T6_OLDCO|nr:OLC1v1001714C1 [Oldenlandia corymbosa var. corymbosa]